MINFKETFYAGSESVIEIERITDTSYFRPFKFIPIENSAYFHFGRRITENPLILPKLYAALTYLTGPSDDEYDHYKGSYSFTFKLTVQKKDKVSKYYYHIFHYRSYIEFSTSQLVSEDDPRESRYYHQPDDKLFPDKDIYSFSISFCENAITRAENDKHIPKPFVKYSNSNLLLFGYSKDEYFFKDYKDENIYKKEKALLQEESASVNL
ncbi:MAG: hypothetical protein LN573_01555 [Rickettsia endosymbiont of Oxypoda opaca]|nr:hypothetical protein [Rickettsia endosymbiont of Oxypoda opaca]